MLVCIVWQALEEVCGGLLILPEQVPETWRLCETVINVSSYFQGFVYQKVYNATQAPLVGATTAGVGQTTHGNVVMPIPLLLRE